MAVVQVRRQRRSRGNYGGCCGRLLRLVSPDEKALLAAHVIANRR